MYDTKFMVGDFVRVRETAKVDIAGIAWPHLLNQIGCVRAVDIARDPNGATAVIYSVEFDHDFRGGFDCLGSCLPKRGQYISQQHLELE